LSDLRDQLDRTLGSHYRIERELGGGGMSRVFVAEELALGRRVVLKVLDAETVQGLSADRFAREAKLAARLQDPRIVPVLAAGAAGDLPYYTMPFVDGESLRARMARAASSGQPVPLAESVSILRDVALALEYAHAHEVVHRDIKPENVLLSGRTALVADFGIARALAAADTTGSARGGTLTRAGVALGTPAYMPPEQATGDAVDHRADIYVWAVIARDLDRAAAVRAAASLGAGRMIEGDIVGNASQLTVTARLASVPNGAERGHRSARGAASQIAVLVDSVIAELLALDAGESEQRVALLASTPLAALEAYLAGQASYRAGRYPDAVDRFDAALQIDSTFALAGFGLSLASSWTLDARGPRGHDVAVRYADKLGMRERLYLGPTDPDSAATEHETTFARREAAVQAAPDSPDLWHVLGENHYHYGATRLGRAEAYRQAIAALERGLKLDSSYAPMLEHLPAMYRYLGDTARARLATDRLMRDTAAYSYSANRVLFARDSASRAAALRDLDSKPVSQSQYAIAAALFDDSDLSFAQDLVQRAIARSATAADRGFFTAMRYYVAIEQGRPGHAARLAAEVPTFQNYPMFAATFHDGDSTAGAKHYAVVKRLVEARPPNDPAGREAWVTAIFDVAQYELVRSETTHAPRVIAQLRRLPPVPGNPVESVRPERLVMILEAQLAKLADRADAPQRLASLDSMLALSPIGVRVRAAGNLVLSELLARAGNFRRAYQVVQRWAPGDMSEDVPPSATYLRAQGRLGAAAGDREGAIAAYRRYLRLRANAEPVLARDIATVRSELAKLERQSAGR